MGGCGCKNKGVAPQQTTQQGQPIQRPQSQSESIQSAIKKTVQKYYNQKK